MEHVLKSPFILYAISIATMAYGRYSLARRGAYYSRGRYGKRYGGAKYKARGQMRAAAQQRDSLSVVIKYAITIDAKTEATSNSAVFYLNMYDMLRRSPMFQAFQNMYDQVKLDGAKIAITQQTSNNTYQSINNPLQIVTAWDRSGLSYNYADADATDGTGQELGFTAISQYSSAFVKPAMYGTFYRTTRAIYPATLEEKGQWVSTGLLVQPGNQLAADALCSAAESTAIKWKPIFIMALQAQATATTGTSFGTFLCEMNLPVTFRGLRKFKTLTEQVTPAPSG